MLRAAHGQLTAAKEDFAKSVEADPRQPFFRFPSALIYLHAGDLDAYRDAAADMLQQFRDTENANHANETLWVCVLGPDALEDYSDALTLASMLIECGPESASILHSVGVLYYRVGRTEEATEQLTEAFALLEDTEGDNPPYYWYFLAMAHHKLGHDAEAHELLDKANEWTDKLYAEHEAGKRVFLGFPYPLELKIIRREAEALLYGA